MRTKSEVRRQAILDGAAKVFQETGFERASMSEIAERLGYSKATLYSYFPSKDKLFFEVLTSASEAEFEATYAALDPSSDDIGKALCNFGRRFLGLLYSPQIMAVRRLVASEAGRADLGRSCYELGPKRGEAEIAKFLGQAMHKGQLRQADARLAAQQLRALLEAEWAERVLFHVVDAPSAREIEHSVAHAVDAFMAIYGPSIRAASEG